jgi:LPS-assembly lipoprotein
MIRTTILAALGFAALGLGGCGFSPIYAAPSGSVAGPLRDVAVQSRGTERVDYLFERAMSDKLGAYRPSGVYKLETVLTETRLGFGIRVDDVATRYESTVTVNYRLVRASDGAVLTQGARSGVASYDVSDDPYSELTAEERSIERAVEVAADKVRLDLTLFFANQPQDS